MCWILYMKNKIRSLKRDLEDIGRSTGRMAGALEECEEWPERLTQTCRALGHRAAERRLFQKPMLL